MAPQGEAPKGEEDERLIPVLQTIGLTAFASQAISFYREYSPIQQLYGLVVCLIAGGIYSIGLPTQRIADVLALGLTFLCWPLMFSGTMIGWEEAKQLAERLMAAAKT